MTMNDPEDPPPMWAYIAMAVLVGYAILLGLLCKMAGD